MQDMKSKFDALMLRYEADAQDLKTQEQNLIAKDKEILSLQGQVEEIKDTGEKEQKNRRQSVGTWGVIG